MSLNSLDEELFTLKKGVTFSWRGHVAGRFLLLVFSFVYLWIWGCLLTLLVDPIFISLKDSIPSITQGEEDRQASVSLYPSGSCVTDEIQHVASHSLLPLSRHKTVVLSLYETEQLVPTLLEPCGEWFVLFTTAFCNYLCLPRWHFWSSWHCISSRIRKKYCLNLSVLSVFIISLILLTIYFFIFYVKLCFLWVHVKFSVCNTVPEGSKEGIRSSGSRVTASCDTLQVLETEPDSSTNALNKGVISLHLNLWFLVSFCYN